jgi:hypothetical protein
MGGKALESLLKQMELIRQYQTNEGMTLIDARTLSKPTPIRLLACLTF